MTAGHSPNHWLLAELTLVWAEFEQQLSVVPIIRRIERHQASIQDYRDLLYNLRQQVVDGVRWITRAASNLTAEHADLRARFIHHAAEEQLDFRMLESDYVACGGDLGDIRSGRRNIGSEALTAFMFSQADQPNPIDLLGAMFVIEGLGAHKASGWIDSLRDQLGLSDDQMRFVGYHGEADDAHTAEMYEVLQSEVITDDVARRIVHTARVVARLYALQLEEIQPAPLPTRIAS